MTIKYYTKPIVIINVKLQILNQFIIFHLKQGDQLAIQAFCKLFFITISFIITIKFFIRRYLFDER